MEHHGYQINYTVGYLNNMRRINERFISQYTYWNGKSNEEYKYSPWGEEYYMEMFIRRFKKIADGNDFYGWLFQ